MLLCTLPALSAWLGGPMTTVKHSNAPRSISISCLSSLTTVQSSGKPCAPTANFACVTLTAMGMRIIQRRRRQGNPEYHIPEHCLTSSLSNLQEPLAYLLQVPHPQYAAVAPPQQIPQILCKAAASDHVLVLPMDQMHVENAAASRLLIWQGWGAHRLRTSKQLLLCLSQKS